MCVTLRLINLYLQYYPSVALGGMTGCYTLREPGSLPIIVLGAYSQESVDKIAAWVYKQTNKQVHTHVFGVFFVLLYNFASTLFSTVIKLKIKYCFLFGCVFTCSQTSVIWENLLM